MFPAHLFMGSIGAARHLKAWADEMRAMLAPPPGFAEWQALPHGERGPIKPEWREWLCRDQTEGMFERFKKLGAAMREWEDLAQVLIMFGQFPVDIIRKLNNEELQQLASGKFKLVHHGMIYQLHKNPVDAAGMPNGICPVELVPFRDVFKGDGATIKDNIITNCTFTNYGKKAPTLTAGKLTAWDALKLAIEEWDDMKGDRRELVIKVIRYLGEAKHFLCVDSDWQLTTIDGGRVSLSQPLPKPKKAPKRKGASRGKKAKQG